MARWMGLAIVPLLLAAAVLAACSNGDDDETATGVSASTTSAGASASTASAAVAAPAPTVRAATVSAADGASSGTDGAAPRVAFEQVDTGRSIVYVGSMLVEVNDDLRQRSSVGDLTPTSALKSSARTCCGWGLPSAFAGAPTSSGGKASRELINLQRDGSQAKPYQVREVRQAVLRNHL